MRRTIYARGVKPLLDRFFAALMLMLFMPVMFVISIFVFAFLGRPIFFLQRRSGKYGKTFSLFKFRSMSPVANSDTTPKSDSERLSPFGNFLRRSSLDEIPQLINILKGEMSFVGPRPLLPQYFDRYSSFELQRLNVKPGLTGLAQINGRNSLSWHEKFILDVNYTELISFKIDLFILMKTLLLLTRLKAVNPEEFSSSDEFLGNAGE